MNIYLLKKKVKICNPTHTVTPVRVSYYAKVRI